MLVESMYRAMNGLRKVAAGLRPFSESVWPGARTDLFVAHESLYELFALHAKGRVVLDAGCGTGYGACKVAESGASQVLGLDVDSRSIAFARKRYVHSHLEFRVDDIEQLSVPAASFDLVIASNSLEHLRTPTLFFRRLRGILRRGGSAFVAVPPIYGAKEAEIHAGIHYHRSNLSVSEWADLIRQEGFAVSGYIHQARGPIMPNVYSHRPSRLASTDFSFVHVPVERLWLEPSITAVFHLTVASRDASTSGD
jgi:SAM-dependent methyltransferase